MSATSPAAPTAGPDSVEVVDEASRTVMIFRTAADAELYGLTGVPNWTHVRVAQPGEVADLSLAALARAL